MSVVQDVKLRQRIPIYCIQEMDLKAARIVNVLLVLLMIIPGCNKERNVSDGEGFLIVTSFYPVYIIAKNVADGIEGTRVVNMTPPYTGCLHDYSVTAADMKRLENASIFLTNGAGMENFIDKIALKYPSLKTAGLSDGIEMISSGGAVNPHIWVSVENAAKMTMNCAGILSVSDSKHAAAYRNNALRYVARLRDLKREMSGSLGKFKGEKIVTFHEAFPYFAKEFGFEIAAVVEREPGSEPSAKELSTTISLVRNINIKYIFAEPQYPSASADVISKETGARVFTLDPAVSGDDDKDAYIKMMKKNLSVLVSAFGDKRS